MFINQDLVDLVVSCQINSFAQLKDFSKTGRVVVDVKMML